jgi:hypothetical protein
VKAIVVLLVVLATPAIAAAQPSVTMERAVALGHRGDHWSALIELGKVVHGETADGEPARRQAELLIGSAFLAVQLYAPATAILTRIARDQAHPYRAAAVERLVALLRDIDAPEAVAAVAAAPPVGDEMHYHRGRHRAWTGDLPGAEADLARIDPASRVFARAQLERAQVALRRGDRATADTVLDALAKDPEVGARAVTLRHGGVTLADACTAGGVDEVASWIDVKLRHAGDPAELTAAAWVGVSETPVVRLAIVDLDGEAQLAWLAALRDDVRRFEQADPAWQTTAVASDAQTEIVLQLAHAEVTVGTWLAARLPEVQAEIRRLRGTGVGPEGCAAIGLALRREVASTSEPAPLPAPPRRRGCGCGAGASGGAGAAVPLALALAARRPRRRRS